MMGGMTGARQDDLERLASEASCRVLVEQESALRDLRSRAGTLLAAASIAVSLLGSGVVEGGELGLVAWLAVGAFTGSLFATLYVLLPREGLVFAIDGRQLYLSLWRIRENPREVYRQHAYWLAGVAASNQVAIDRAEMGYRAAALSLVVQVLLWIAELSTTM
jgi:hypothetical protein